MATKTTRTDRLEQALVGKTIRSVRTEEETLEFVLDGGEMLTLSIEAGVSGAYISISLNGEEIGRSD